MPPRDRREEDRELLKLVGAVLDNTTSSGGPPWWVKLRNRLLPTRVVRAVRRHRLFKLAKKYRMAMGSASLCLVPLYTLLVMTSSSAQEDAPLLSAGPPATAPTPDLPTWRQDPAEAPNAAQDTNALGYWFALLKDPDWQKRSAAAYELRKRSRESNMVASSLVLILEDAHAGPRFWAADGLRKRELHLERVKEAVRRFAGNGELLHMYQAGSLKMRDSFERVLKRWLRDQDDLYRWTALTLCGTLKSSGETFRPYLELIAEVDPQPNFRRQADILLRSL